MHVKTWLQIRADILREKEETTGQLCPRQSEFVQNTPCQASLTWQQPLGVKCVLPNWAAELMCQGYRALQPRVTLLLSRTQSNVCLPHGYYGHMWDQKVRGKFCRGVSGRGCGLQCWMSQSAFRPRLSCDTSAGTRTMLPLPEPKRTKLEVCGCHNSLYLCI